MNRDRTQTNYELMIRAHGVKKSRRGERKREKSSEDFPEAPRGHRSFTLLTRQPKPPLPLSSWVVVEVEGPASKRRITNYTQRDISDERARPRRPMGGGTLLVGKKMKFGPPGDSCLALLYMGVGCGDKVNVLYWRYVADETRRARHSSSHH